MGLLDKLEQVEIKADSRLPEDDLMFCETHQQAYDESCRALREIRQQWKKAIQAQRDLLGIGQDGARSIIAICGIFRCTMKMWLTRCLYSWTDSAS